MKLSKAQKEVLDVLQSGNNKTLEVGPGLVQPRTAGALVRKGFCEYGLSLPWGDKERYLIIRLKNHQA